MTLELLFAQAAQVRTFLLLTQCGALLGALIFLGGVLRRCHPWLGGGCDLLCACVLAAACGQILLRSGEGLRLYGLLGLCIGGAAACALCAWGERLWGDLRQRILPPKEKKS